jgi:hypothetical protein
VASGQQHTTAPRPARFSRWQADRDAETFRDGLNPGQGDARSLLHGQRMVGGGVQRDGGPHPNRLRAEVGRQVHGGSNQGRRTSTVLQTGSQVSTVIPLTCAVASAKPSYGRGVPSRFREFRRPAHPAIRGPERSPATSAPGQSRALIGRVKGSGTIGPPAGRACRPSTGLPSAAGADARAPSPFATPRKHCVDTTSRTGPDRVIHG